MATVILDELTPGVIPEAARKRLAGWEIKTEADLARVLSQAKTVPSGKGCVLRLPGYAEERDQEHSLPPAPEWNTLGGRGETAKLLYESGLKSKAYRYGRCARYGIFLQGHELFCDLRGKSFGRYKCGLRFCAPCASKNFRDLFDKYRDGFVGQVEANKERPGYVLARINFTIRCDGQELKPEQVRAFNKAVRKLIRRSFPKLKRPDYGFAWCDEFGHPKSKRQMVRKAKGWNLHAHGLWFGPYFDWHLARDLWRELTGSTGFWISKIDKSKKGLPSSVSKGLGHMLKYVAKLPGETPERIAGLERVFDGVVRVHRMGFFYDLPDPSQKSRPGSDGWTCSHCGHALFPERPFRLCLIADFGEGMVDIGEANREVGKRLAMGGGP